MVAFLSDGWLTSLAEAARTTEAPADLHLVVQQVVTDDDGTEVAYAVRVADGRVAVVPGRVPDAQVTFTQDRATALAVATGELSAQAAFLDGRLRVGGDLQALLDRSGALVALGDVFAAARAELEG